MRSLPKIIKGAGQGVQRFQYEEDLVRLAREMCPEKAEEIPLTDKEEASEIVDLALKQSEEILAVARVEGEKIIEEARVKGYNAGYNDGHEEGYWQAYNENTQKLEQDRESLLEEVQRSIAEIEIKKQELLERHLEDLKNISVAIAEKVIQVSLKSSGDVIQRMIVAATEKLKKSQWAKIYISKYDAEAMTKGDAQLLNALSYLSDNIKIIPMDNEESGTCIVELPKEIIDVSVGTQLENIKEILNNVQL